MPWSVFDLDPLKESSRRAVSIDTAINRFTLKRAQNMRLLPLPKNSSLTKSGVFFNDMEIL